MGTDLGQRLLKLKEQLDGERARHAELQGELRAVLRQLQQEFGIGSLEDAERQVAVDEVELRALQSSLETQIAELERVVWKQQ